MPPNYPRSSIPRPALSYPCRRRRAKIWGGGGGGRRRRTGGKEGGTEVEAKPPGPVGFGAREEKERKKDTGSNMGKWRRTGGLLLLACVWLGKSVASLRHAYYYCRYTHTRPILPRCRRGSTILPFGKVKCWGRHQTNTGTKPTILPRYSSAIPQRYCWGRQYWSGSQTRIAVGSGDMASFFLSLSRRAPFW